MCETTSYNYSNPTEDGLRLESSTHFPSHRNDDEMQSDASLQKKPTDDFEQYSSKGNDESKEKTQPLDCPDGSLGKQVELKTTNRVAAWEENPDRDVNTHRSSDKILAQTHLILVQ